MPDTYRLDPHNAATTIVEPTRGEALHDLERERGRRVHAEETAAYLARDVERLQAENAKLRAALADATT